MDQTSWIVVVIGGAALVAGWAGIEIRRAKRFLVAITAIQVLAIHDPGEAVKLLDKLMKAHQG